MRTRNMRKFMPKTLAGCPRFALRPRKDDPCERGPTVSRIWRPGSTNPVRAKSKAICRDRRWASAPPRVLLHLAHLHPKRPQLNLPQRSRIGCAGSFQQRLHLLPVHPGRSGSPFADRRVKFTATTTAGRARRLPHPAQHLGVVGVEHHVVALRKGRVGLLQPDQRLVPGKQRVRDRPPRPSR